MTNMSQEAIDKLLQKVDFALPPLDVIENTMTLPALPKSWNFPKKKPMQPNYHYESASRYVIGITGICGCGTKLTEIKIKARGRDITGLWCEHCNINYSESEVKSWRPQ